MHQVQLAKSLVCGKRGLRNTIIFFVRKMIINSTQYLSEVIEYYDVWKGCDKIQLYSATCLVLQKFGYYDVVVGRTCLDL